MKPFLSKDFLLSTPTAVELYHDHAAKMPIYDYHCHLDPQQIYEDVRFENITQVWLAEQMHGELLLCRSGLQNDVRALSVLHAAAVYYIVPHYRLAYNLSLATAVS